MPGCWGASRSPQSGEFGVATHRSWACVVKGQASSVIALTESKIAYVHFRGSVEVEEDLLDIDPLRQR